MRFAPTDEQEQLQEAARGWLSETPNPSWNRLIEEQGWPAIAIDEAFGGFGFGFVELALVSEEIGRVLAPVPLLASAGLAAGAIDTGGSVSQKTSLLAAIAEGTRAALAYEGQLEAVRNEEGWHLTGTALRVIDGADAQFLIVATDQGLFHVTDFQASHLHPGLHRPRRRPAAPRRPPAGADARVGTPGRRSGGCRGSLPGHGGGIRQGPHPVRQTDR